MSRHLCSQVKTDGPAGAPHTASTERWRQPTVRARGCGPAAGRPSPAQTGPPASRLIKCRPAGFKELSCDVSSVQALLTQAAAAALQMMSQQVIGVPSDDTREQCTDRGGERVASWEERVAVPERSMASAYCWYRMGSGRNTPWNAAKRCTTVRTSHQRHSRKAVQNERSWTFHSSSLPQAGQIGHGLQTVVDSAAQPPLMGGFCQHSDRLTSHLREAQLGGVGRRPGRLWHCARQGGARRSTEEALARRPPGLQPVDLPSRGRSKQSADA